MKIISKITLVLITSYLAVGCSSLVRQKDEIAVKNTKKAAIVAITSYQPDTSSISLTNGKLGATTGSGSLFAENSSHVARMYEDLRTAIEKKLEWQVLDKNTVFANSSYKEAFQATMVGWQFKAPPRQGENKFGIEGMLEAEALDRLGSDGRKKLVEGLGVDAIIVAMVDVKLNGTTVMGIGKRYPQATVSFRMYNANSEKPFWFDGYIAGDESTESVGTTSFINLDLLNDLSVESAKTAFLRIAEDR